MTKSSNETWQKLAEAWIGVAPRDEHFDSWMKLNLRPPLGEHLPEKFATVIEADPRALSFVQRHLRSRFQWESTWVDWMPNNEISNLLLAPVAILERALILTGAVCCRELIATTIARTERRILGDALGGEVLQRLASRPALARLPIPASARMEDWAGDPASTLRRSGLLCLRVAIAPYPKAIEIRLTAMFPDPVWKFSAPSVQSAESDAALRCIQAARQLDQSL
jgi:hypothetical protein